MFFKSKPKFYVVASSGTIFKEELRDIPFYYVMKRGSFFDFDERITKHISFSDATSQAERLNALS